MQTKAFPIFLGFGYINIRIGSISFFLYILLLFYSHLFIVFFGGRGMYKFCIAISEFGILQWAKEPWDISEVIRDKLGINKNIPGLGPQKKYTSRATSAAEKACLSRMTPNWRMRKWNNNNNNNNEPFL